MAGTQIVGKVAVKVIPDTKNFRQDARDDLEKVEKRLPKLKVTADFSDTGLRAEVLKTLRALNADLRDKAIYKIKFTAAITDQGMRGEVARAARELTKIAREKDITFKINADVTKALVAVDIDEAAKERVARDLKDWADDLSPLKVAVKPEILNGSPTAVNARLAVLTRPRLVPIIPVVDNKAAAAVATTLAALSGARLIVDQIDSIIERLKNLDKAIPIIGTLAEAILGLGAFGLTAASNLFALAQSLAQIGPAILTLPGIFGGMAIGIGATVAVLKDFNDVFPDVGEALSALQDKMSAVFWETAAEPIREMIDTLLPRFSAGLVGTAESLGIHFAAIANSISGELAPALAGMFDDLNKSIEVAGTGADAFAGIITILGEVGAGYLPRLAQWFVDVSERFNTFLTEAAADGRLEGWIERALDNLSALGSVLFNLGGIFSGLARAAEEAGGSTLQMFATTLEDINATVNSPTFQSALVDTLEAAHEAMNAISTNAGPAFSDFMLNLSSLLTTVLPTVGDTLGTAFAGIFDALNQPAVINGVVDVFSGIAQAVDALAPALGPVGELLGGLLSIIGTMAATFGPLLATVFSGLAQALLPLVPVIQSLVELLGGALLNAIGPLVEPLVSLGETLADVFINTLIPALTPLVNGIGQLLAEVLPLVVTYFQELVVALQPLLERIGQLIAFLVPVLIPVLKFLAEVILASIVMAVEGVVGVVEGVIAIFEGLWQFISGVFTGNWSQAWDGIKTIFSGVWEAIVGIVKVALNVGILGVFGKVFAVFRGTFKAGWVAVRDIAIALWNGLKSRWKTFLDDLKAAPGAVLESIKRLFKGAWDDLKAAAGLALDGIKWYFENTWGRVISVLRELPGKIKEVFTNAPTLLVDAGKKIIEGLINGIKGMFDSVKNTLGDLTSKLTDWKGPAERDAVLLVDAGRLIIGGLIEGLESRYKDVRSSLADLTDDISKTEMESPLVEALSRGVSARLEGAVTGGLDPNSSASRTFIYNAAPGSSLGSEEDLFAAVQRGRMVDW